MWMEDSSVQASVKGADTVALSVVDEVSYRQIVDLSPDAIFIQCDGEFMFINPAGISLFGLESAQQLMGMPVMKFVTPGSRRAVKKYFRRGQGTKQARSSLEATWLTSSGAPFLAAVTVSPFLHRGKDGSLVILRDITERKRVEETLARATHAAERANRAKSSFLATMSHEIRTPMNAVLGMLELLSLSSLDQDQRFSLETARESTNWLLRIIDDVLDFSKIEAGYLEIRLEPASIAEMVDRAAAVYSDVARGKGLRLEKIVDPNISPAVMVDRLRLRQVLNNLLSNAIKFTDQGHVEIRAKLLERRGECDVVGFEVRDTGIGVAAEDQQRLFQPFIQVDSDTTRKFGGTGLGLTICARLARMMGGEIAIDSKLGEGTTIFVTLPLPITNLAVLTDAKNKGRSADDGRLLRPQESRNAQVVGSGDLFLVVDDHPVNRQLLLKQLNTLGYIAEGAGNGVEAFEAWKTGRFARIIADCRMPGMDGYELARQIRRAEAQAQDGRHTLIIAWTASALEGDAELALAAGMDDYMAKPADLSTMKHKLAAWILPIRPAMTPVSPGGKQIDLPLEGPIDLTRLREISLKDEAFEQEILTEFRDTIRKDLDTLRRGLVSKDLNTVAHIAHHMRGASRLVGALLFAAECELFERLAVQNNWEALSAMQVQFFATAERLDQALGTQLAFPAPQRVTFPPGDNVDG